MKRIISLLICLTMILSSISVFAAVPFELNTITVTYAENASESSGIVVSGKYDKPLVLRVFNDSGILEYIGTTDSKDGIFQFDSFKLEKPAAGSTANTYTFTYKFVISDESDIKKSEDVTFNYVVKGSSGPSGPSGPTVKEPEIDWPGKIDTPVNPDIPGGEPSGPAYTDPINETAVQAAAKQTSASGGVKFIESTTKNTDDVAMGWESTRNTIAVSVETMMANIGSKKISTSSSTNKLVLKESSISDADLKKYTDTEKTLNDAMNKNKITLNRELTKEYIVNTTFSTTKKANITIYKKFVDKLAKVGIETLTINDKNFRVSYSLTELYKMIGDKEFTSFDIDTTAMSSSTKKLTVNFDTDKTQSVKISFPGLSADAKYMAIVDENGNPVGGRYNPATGAIEAKISESGVYQIVNNEKDFEDIKHLSDEMQESIKILAAKGIIEGTSAKEFSPEDSISRAEVAALLLRVLSQVDPNADGGFADVKKSDWFYGTAGSAKAYGMILGFEDNTFRGNVTIAKDQILAIASRVLQREMKYITPDKPEEWLTFADASSIADWAANDIALTTMANIVTRTADNTIHADEDMTRGDAALIIMRLFYKIW